MANYSINASSAIRNYLWDQLKSQNSDVNIGHKMFDEQEYDYQNTGNIWVPIFPSQQEPELDGFFQNKKHIIYNYVADGYEDNWLICRDSMLFTIYSSNYSEIVEIQEFMLDLFRRMDDSAKDVNNYLGQTSPFIFYSISLTDMLSPEPEVEKAGLMAGQVMIRYKYGRVVTKAGRFS